MLENTKKLRQSCNFQVPGVTDCFLLLYLPAPNVPVSYVEYTKREHLTMYKMQALDSRSLLAAFINCFIWGNLYKFSAPHTGPSSETDEDKIIRDEGK